MTRLGGSDRLMIMIIVPVAGPTTRGGPALRPWFRPVGRLPGEAGVAIRPRRGCAHAGNRATWLAVNYTGCR